MAGSDSNKKPSMFDLEKQFIFYASYHNNPVNVFIHLVCIWNIGASMICLLQYTPAIAPLPAPLQDALGTNGLNVNVALFLCLFYTVMYLIMEPVLGVFCRSL